MADRAGFTDTPDMMYDYLMSFDRDGIMDADLVRTFCDNSAENIQWLVDRGVQMQDVEPIHSSLTRGASTTSRVAAARPAATAASSPPR